MTNDSPLLPRGLRNHNPGNLRRTATRYAGECDGNDREFRTFISDAWGYRAMFVLLHTYSRRYGLHTIASMIERYAPPQENNTAAYISRVSYATGLDPHTTIDTLDRETMCKIVAAMSAVENGRKANDTDIASGWSLFMGGA